MACQNVPRFDGQYVEADRHVYKGQMANVEFSAVSILVETIPEMLVLLATAKPKGLWELIVIVVLFLDITVWKIVTKRTT